MSLRFFCLTPAGSGSISWCVLVFRFCLQPVIPGSCLWCRFCLQLAVPRWGLWFVCLCECLAFSSPILAPLCGVCVSALVLFQPRHPWPGFVVCDCLRVLPTLCYSWLGCVVCVGQQGLSSPGSSQLRFVVCVFVCGLGLHFANPGSGLWYVCLCADSIRTLPMLAEDCGVRLCAGLFFILPILAAVCGVCVLALVVSEPRQSWPAFMVSVCAQVSSAPLHSRLGSVVCARVWGFPSPRRSSLGLELCVSLRWFNSCPADPPLGFASVFVGRFCLQPTITGCGLWSGCLCAGFSFISRILARVCGVCVCVFFSPASRHSSLGFVVCLFVVTFAVHPAIPGWGVWCVRLRAGFPFTQPFLAGALVCPACAAPLTALSVAFGPALACPWVVSRSAYSLPLCVCSRFAAAVGRYCLTPANVPWFWLVACLCRLPWGLLSERCAPSGPLTLGTPLSCPVAAMPSLPGSSPLTWCIAHAVFVSVAPRGTWRRVKNKARGARLQAHVDLGSPRVAFLQSPGAEWSLRDANGVGLALRALHWCCVCGSGHSRVRFPIPSALRQGTRLVHGRFLMSTGAPSLAGCSAPCEGSLHVYLCVSVLGWMCLSASWARFGTPHLSCGLSRRFICSLGSLLTWSAVRWCGFLALLFFSVGTRGF